MRSKISTYNRSIPFFNWKLGLALTLIGTPLSAQFAMAAESSSSTITTVPILQSTISGKVVDAEGKPIAGVTVNEKGTNNSTSTNNNGTYTLKVNSTSVTLVVRFMGYQTIEVKGTNAGLITLSADEDLLEEVVVVAYGSQKRANVTTAVTQVDKKVLENRPSPSIANMLQGAAPGLVVTRNSGRPGAQGLNLQIRGASSANGTTPPLYVIDGVLSSESAFTAINPSDIENISVLKDAGATAIYGTDGAGGAVLITTKAGRSGQSRISFNSNLGVQRPGNIPKRLSLIDEMNYVNLARQNAGVGAEYSPEDLNYAVNGPTFVLGSNGQWRTYNQESLIDQVVQKKYNIYNNNLQFSGGNESVTYLASLGHMSQNGMFKVGEDKYGRLNGRVNLSAKVNQYLKLDIRSAYVKEDTDNPQDGGYGIDGGGNGILRQFYSSRMRFPIYNEDGTYYRSGTSSAFGYALLKDGGFNRDRQTNYINNFTATFNNFIDGLDIRLIYGREDRIRENRNFRRTVTYYSGPTPSTSSQLNNPNNYSVTNYNWLKENAQVIADYKFSLNNSHNFHVMGGFQWDHYKYKNVFASTKGLYVNDNPSLNFTSDPLNKSNSQGSEEEVKQAFFGRLTYNYKEKYLFETTIRRDESSRLTPGNRVNIFPSFSAGWNISKEDWFEGMSKTINDLKLRGSWGKVGLQKGIGYYDHIAMLGTGTNVLLGDTRQTYSFQNMIPGTEMGWETVEDRNVGLDFSLLNRKLTGSFDYYNKFNNNMFVSINYPATIGINVPKSNDARLKAWGWEFGLAYKDKTASDFSYNVGVSLADNRNRLIDFRGNGNIINSGINATVEGYALNSIWGYKTDGYFQSQEEVDKAPKYTRILNKTGVPGIGDIRYVDIDGDGEITPGKNIIGDTGDLVYLGDTNPRYQFGINADFSYKNFDFTFFIQGIGKRNLKPSNELIQPQLYSYYLPMSFHMDYWTEDNRDAAFPRPYLEGNHNFVNSEKWFVSGAYARLKNVQLGYTLNKQNFAKLPFSRVRVYVSGEDLLTVSKLGIFKGAIDPEIRPEDNKISPYPFATTISFGLNIDL
ncbi:TonB-linked outer membrane protein, SusC/RagA family [Sphingobacterium nematocida]|uniref:TonB-linked outer membrane protein, SusC/RagA family n=1 Tax=Sphingobacterium nematocida TaxID=1513896 RepID=A0A1T5CS74_9SPHI|nr:TonB-dependent receptor [Sphingobacterium nematocida]SKB62206.1 TonB-linked outer membrane protein, SusC/RagA family [Sphingobacterium nematocida]